MAALVICLSTEKNNQTFSANLKESSRDADFVQKNAPRACGRSLIVISWVGDLVLSRIHILRNCTFERDSGLGQPQLRATRCRIGDDLC